MPRCMILAWEHGPESISLEGGGEAELRLPVPAVLVEAEAGWVLLDTGLGPATAHDPAWGGRVYTGTPPELPSERPLADALAAHGVTVDDLALAAVSHLHIDHTGGLRELAGRVPVAVQRAELEFALGAATVAEAYARIDYDGGIEWLVLDGDGPITPGVDAVFTPGHTPGHMSFRVQTPDGPWLFAADAIDLQRGLDEDRAIGSSAREQDAPLRRASHDRLVALAAAEGARLVPGHCPQTWPALAGQV